MSRRQTRRPTLDFACRFLVCLAVTLIFSLVISALAWFCGFGWQLPSTLGWMVSTVIAPVVGSALVALRMMPESRVLGDVRANGLALRHFLGASATMMTLALIMVGSFGLRDRAGGEPDDCSIILNRRDYFGAQWPLASVREEPSLFEADLSEVVPGEGLLSMRELEQMGLESALVPCSGTGAEPRLGWFSTRRGDRWPLVFPGRRLPVESPSEASRLASISITVEPDPNRPRFGVASLAAPTPVPPGLARSAPEQWWSVPVGPEVARLEGQARPRSFRSGPLYPLSVAASKSSVTVDSRADPIVVTLFQSAVGSTYEGRPVLGSGVGPASRFLRLWREDEPYDLLGEGRDASEPPQLMSGLVRTWRSRDASAPGFLAVPAKAARAPGVAPWVVLTQRGLPDDRPSLAEWRAALALATLVLILTVVQCVQIVLDR